MARQFETDGEDNRAASVVENTEFGVENEDEADQAKASFIYTVCAPSISHSDILAQYLSLFCFAALFGKQ